MQINTATKSTVALTITNLSTKQSSSYTRDIYFPEDLIMENLIGDGAAKVSMTMERSDKNYGNGVSVSATVSLTVNQKEETVAEAFDVIRLVLVDEVQKAIEEARKFL